MLITFSGYHIKQLKIVFVFSFSNLFSTTERPQRKPLPYVNVRYSAPTHLVSPALDTMRKRSLNDRKRGLDFMDGEL
jgi:hypothetical protein